MAEPIIKLTRGVPTTIPEWNDIFKRIGRFLKVSGDSLIIEGDITLPPGSVTTTELADDSVTNGKLRDSSAASVIGRAADSGGNPGDIIAVSDGTFLVRRSGTLAFGAIQDADLPSSIARDTEVSAAITAHEGASNPHPGYLTPAEGDAAYQPLGTTVSQVEAEAGTSTTVRNWTAERVNQAIQALAPGGGTDLTYTASTRLLASSTGTDATLPLVSSSDAGLAPASGGGTSNFLRADGTWTTPGGGGSPGGSNTQIQYNNASSFGGIAGFTWNGTVLGIPGTSVFAAGSATAGSWPKLTSGTLLTTPEVGAIELDANCFYGTTDAGNRGYIPVKHFIRAITTRNLPNDTNENAIFDSPTNGRLTLEAGTYRVEGMLSISSMSATSGNASIDILGAGTATCDSWLWTAQGRDNTSAVNAAAVTGTFTITQQSVASVVTAGTGTGLNVWIMGTFEVTTGGTIIPSIDLVTASAAVLREGSYFMFERIGAVDVVSVGDWD